MGHLNHLIEHFGYLGIIIALVGGIIGLPIPDEVLLTYVGYNVFAGKLVYLPSLLCAYFGASIGITLSFILGIVLGLLFYISLVLNCISVGQRLTEQRNYLISTVRSCYLSVFYSWSPAYYCLSRWD